jgi:hypothetical protein
MASGRGPFPGRTQGRKGGTPCGGKTGKGRGEEKGKEGRRRTEEKCGRRRVKKKGEYNT